MVMLYRVHVGFINVRMQMKNYKVANFSTIIFPFFLQAKQNNVVYESSGWCPVASGHFKGKFISQNHWKYYIVKSDVVIWFTVQMKI